MNHTYYIEGCPIPFHDLPELFTYVVNAGKLLYQYQFLTVYLDKCVPLLWIIIERNYFTCQDFVTYKEYPQYMRMQETSRRRQKNISVLPANTLAE